MSDPKELLVSEKREEIVAIFERMFEAHKEGKISRHKAADTVVVVIDALRNKKAVDAEGLYDDLLYLFAILDL